MSLVDIRKLWEAGSPRNTHTKSGTSCQMLMKYLNRKLKCGCAHSLLLLLPEPSPFHCPVSLKLEEQDQVGMSTGIRGIGEHQTSQRHLRNAKERQPVVSADSLSWGIHPSESKCTIAGRGVRHSRGHSHWPQILEVNFLVFLTGSCHKGSSAGWGAGTKEEPASALQVPS